MVYFYGRCEFCLNVGCEIREVYLDIRCEVREVEVREVEVDVCADVRCSM